MTEFEEIVAQELAACTAEIREAMYAEADRIIAVLENTTFTGFGGV